jgi:CRP-like cAMP-binding protein
MDLRERLAPTWFFKGIEGAHLDALLAFAREEVWPAGKDIILEGEPAENFYVLLRGVVSLKMNAREQGEWVLSTLRETGETFGWSALVERGRSTATVECLEESQVISFRKEDLESLFAQNPALGYQFMKRLAILISRRLERTRSLLMKEIT